MKIVIDIPDGYVGVIMKNQRMEGSIMDKLIRQAIIDGTPLPKGHGRLIDYDDMKRIAVDYGEYTAATLSQLKPKTIIEADTESEG